MEQKIEVQTPLGMLTACVGHDRENFPGIYLYLVRPDGVEIDLVLAEVSVATKQAKAYLYGDTSTDQWTGQHIWRESEINIEE